MTGVDPRARLAAGNNADLCETIFRAHRLDYRRDGGMFLSFATPPPYYPSMTTLEPDDTVRQRQAIARLRAGGAFAVKDGFCRLDLEPEGFRSLFDASWLWAPPGSASPPPGWERIATPAALGRWEASWGKSSPAPTRVFPAALVGESGIAFFGRRVGDSYDAGCIVNRSREVAGLSNVFAADAAAEPFAEATAVARTFAPNLPLVGYDRGSALDAMRACGFTEVGRLRVWIFEP